MRLFVAVDPSPAVRDRLDQAMRRLRAMSPRSKWVTPAGFHLTLAFLGDVDEGKLPALASALAEVAALRAGFSLRFRGGGCFGSPRRPRVLWAGVEGAVDALAALQADVVAALEPLGFPREERTYSPHLTLARAVEPRGDAALADCVDALAEEFGATAIDELILYRSDLGPGGAKYTALERLRLGAAR